MAWLIANKDGTSNAKAGDYVVTGGGVYKKNTDGTSSFVEKLPTASGKASSYNELKDVYSKSYGGWIGSSGGGSSGGGSSGGSGPYGEDGPQEPKTPGPTEEPITFDVNGIGTLGGSNDFTTDFTPGYYPVYPVSSGEGVKNFFGYIILALVSLVILDRLIGGKGGK